MLSELVASVARLTDVESIARCLTQQIKWLLPATRCSLLLFDRPPSTWRILPTGQSGPREALTGCLALAIERQSQVVEDDDQREAGSPVYLAAFDSAARSRLVLPLAGLEGPLGSLNLSSTQSGAYSQRAWALPSLLQANLAATIERVYTLGYVRVLNETLEQRVLERTGQLETAVKELRVEAGERERAEAALRHQLFTIR